MTRAPWANPGVGADHADTGADRAGAVTRTSSRRPLFIGATLLIAVAIGVGGLGASLVLRPHENGPAAAGSIAVVETPMDGPTVIDVPTEDFSLSATPVDGGQGEVEGVVVAIPPGAVTTDTTVTVRLLLASFHMDQGTPSADGEAPVVAVGPTVDLGPEGSLFNEAVLVSLPYDPESLPRGATEEAVTPAYWNGSSWVALAGVVDQDADTVSVRLRAFPGVVVTTVAAATVMVIGAGAGIKAVYDNWGELKWSDAVTEGTASQHVRSTEIVRDYASRAVVTDRTTGDRKSLADLRTSTGADWLAKSSKLGHDMRLTYLDAAGQAQAIGHDTGPGSNWQTPDHFFTVGDANGPRWGDCTDTANSAISVFLASGIPAKGVFGYNANDGAAHAWAEVAIGGRLYKMDEDGIYSPESWKSRNLPTYNPASAFWRHANSMWDDKGQAPYDPNWWQGSTSTPPTAVGGWELADVVIDHYLNVAAGVSIEGNGRGGIASVERWPADGTSASARLTATWKIPDRLAPGSRVNVAGSLALTKDYETVGSTCEDGTYDRGPQDGSLDVTVLSQAGAAPVFSDLVQQLIRTGLSISVGCNTATHTFSAEDSATGSFTVPDQITPAAGETAFLVVRFEVEHDSDRVRVAYVYKMLTPTPSASTDPCPNAAGGGPTCVQIGPDYIPGLSPAPSK